MLDLRTRNGALGVLLPLLYLLVQLSDEAPKIFEIII
jgi:hypothetical protein